MTIDTVDISGIILGMIEEDERFKRMIEEGNKRLEKIIIKIDESTKEILVEIIKKV